MMKVISNATPLIIFSRINKLHLLKDLFKEIIITPAVYDELIVKGRGKAGAKRIQSARWIKVEEVKYRLAVDLLLDEMDKGEAETIVLAAETKNSLVLIDNKRPYEKAKSVGIKVQRTLSILLSCYKKGLISNFKETLDKVRSKGFYLDDETYSRILKQAEE